MNKKLVGVLFTLVLLAALSVPVFAQNRAERIEIYATIQEDGSMRITQVWDGIFTEGTENYIPMNAPDYLAISGLTVTDSNGVYETVDKWDVDWSFEEKANKCGINDTKSGYEICFGISQYGENRYAIEYKLDNAVAGYTDVDGVNFRFVNDAMNTTPTDVRVEIRLWDGTPITDETADIWAFGFDGQVEFSDGAIVAYTENPIHSNHHVTVMFSLDKGIVSPSRTENTSFQTVKERAFDGSGYSNEDDGFVLSIILFIAGIAVACTAIVLIYVAIGKKKMRDFVAKTDYFRTTPNEGNINATYTLGRAFQLCSENSIIETNMLNLIGLGCITPIANEQTGFMGRVIEDVNLQIHEVEITIMTVQEEKLYSILKRAAGESGVLQQKELKKFIAKHDKVLRSYIDSCVAAGNAYIKQRDCMNSYALPSKIKYLTPSGEKELGELIGFKKYLEDFSLVAEREIKETPLWKELFSYAMLFGIADRLAEQMKELSPDISEEVDVYTSTVHTAYAYHNILYSSMIAAETKREEQRSEESGGSASFGGGGGSIGGDSGGGSR